MGEGNKRDKTRNGPEWALSVLDGVLSSSAALCWLVSWCNSSIGSVGAASANVSVCGSSVFQVVLW